MSPSSVPNGTSGPSLRNGSTVHHAEEASSFNHDHSSSASPPVLIAIVGMSCRFSGDVNSPEKLWELCEACKDGWSPIPEARFDIKSLYHPDKEKQGRTHVVGGYFLNEDVALFDAAFFNFSGEVASSTDPQFRLLLEAVYEATEDAGMPIEKLAGSNTSVFTGCFNKDYHELQTKDPEVLPHSFMADTGTAMHSNRISHFYDLQGPSTSIDTGCSAGLVALHQGCQSIRCGESNISVVGAASTLLSPDSFIAASSLGALGGDGRCYAWDTRAQGFGRGERVAALIPKPLDAALKDGDHVHAAIRESGVNQDGKTTTISSPSADAQIKLIQECYKRAGLDLSDTGYVEAHMTGTPAGDPIEAAALASTFGKSRATHDPIIVGSVKTNVGHTEPVSGLAAVIKAAFVLKNGLIPPNLNYEKTNPSIHLKEWRVDGIDPMAPGQGASRFYQPHIIMEPAPKTHAKLNGALPSENGTQDSGKSHIYIFSAKH
ncbi:hypothetical protein VE02_08866 [Pseudogymnoascus sp. 03VT05]|nr:hypothetical protein VE02_08866 [Pseudogymnoascus sp. 03VT05]